MISVPRERRCCHVLTPWANVFFSCPSFSAMMWLPPFSPLIFVATAAVLSVLLFGSQQFVAQHVRAQHYQHISEEDSMDTPCSVMRE